jgi:membrane protein DedA with SNARE-associated domain
MLNTVLTWVATYGYGVIFLLLVGGVVGLPIPDETLLVYCGYLIGRGTLHPAPAFFSALAGSWCGISLSYTIGRTLGAGAVTRYGKRMHLTEERMARVQQWFGRIGHWALFVGYFVAGVRHVTALTAGTSKLRFPSFVAYAWSGGAVWVATFLTLGYYLGDNWKRVAELLHRDIGYASLVLIAAALVAFLLRMVLRERRRKVPAPSKS